MKFAMSARALAPPDEHNLQKLEARLRKDLACLCLPAKRWVPPSKVDGHEVLNVVIVGGGMSGLALSASLLHLGIEAPLVERAPEGFEGPWSTTARMETLRSPKELTGPALGFAALTFNAWFEAQFGQAAWAALDKIPRLQWADYLHWYRKVLGLDVRNLQRVVKIHTRSDEVVQLDMADDANAGRPYRLLARHVVLATGRDGLGGPWVPAWAHEIPRDRWVHSGEVWDGDRFRDQRVAVIGGGASAMDVAATALEAGATRVDLLIRRNDLPRINKGKGSSNPGMAQGFCTLPDDWKWRFRHYLNVQQVPPPHGSTLRVSAHRNAYFHLGAAVRAVKLRCDGVMRIDTSKGPMAADAIIFSTGFRSNWALRPELSNIAPYVRLWADRFTPPAGEEDSELAESPDLGPLFEFQSKVPGACPGLERVHCFNYAGALSQGAGSGDIPQISDGAQRLARGLAGQLLREDAQHHFEEMGRYADPELLGDEWHPAEFPPYLPESGEQEPAA